jgi:O-antigen/teichoic acid export membrane protein
MARNIQKTCDPGLVSAAVAALSTWSTALFEAGAWDGLLSLVDQAVFSAASFLTTIMVGRYGTHDLGTYSLGFTIVLMFMCVANGMITAPYTVYGNRLEGARRAEYVGSVLVQCGLLAALALVGLTLAAWGLSRGIGPRDAAPLVTALAAAVPFVLVRQFARELTFAHLQVVAVLILDLLVAMLQLGGLGYLAVSGRLSAVTAHLMVGAACAAGALGWFVLARPPFRVRRAQLLPALRQNWAFGRWVLASQMSLVCHSYLVYWLVAWKLGIAATGVLAACETIVAFSNPFMFGMNNYLGPRVARAFAEGGRLEVRRMVGKSALFLGGVMALVCGGVALFGGRLVCVLYGNGYAGRGSTIAILAIGIFVSALGQSPGLGLLAMERSDVTFRLRVQGMCVTAVSAWFLIEPWGILGAACALLAGHLTTATAAVLTYRRVLATAPRTIAVARDLPIDIPLEYTLPTGEHCAP